nr:helix-turn-helix transcriptional regulator [Rhodococcus sp. 15-649-1-2]
MTEEWRFDVIVNPGLLIAHMDFAGHTCRTLAAKVGCSHSTIGHYRTGTRKNCTPARAKAIAKALNAPLKPLFLPTVSRVARVTAPAA